MVDLRENDTNIVKWFWTYDIHLEHIYLKNAQRKFHQELEEPSKFLKCHYYPLSKNSCSKIGSVITHKNKNFLKIFPKNQECEGENFAKFPKIRGRKMVF